ncbi:MAG: DUF1732 domain-containing protein [bacterium]
MSMTGYSSKAASVDVPGVGKISLSIEMKSINSRFFEVVCKMPGVLSSIEIKVHHFLQKKLRRGRIYFTVRFAEDNEAFEDIVPSLKSVEGYLRVAHIVKERFKVVGDLTLSDLFQQPNIFVTGRSELTEDEEKIILDIIDQAAERLIKARKEEGKALLDDLQKRFQICTEQIEEVRKLSEELLLSIKKKIDEKLALVEKGDELAKLQLEDLYATLNKVDVHEEITRFKSHLKSIDNLLGSDRKEKGKRFDFILQELLRETNTTMAKCSHYDISSICVDVKVELEKAREQVQNIV